MARKKNDREIIEELVARDSRFRRESYHFVQQALGFTLKRIIEEQRRDLKNPPHVTGQELLAGVRDLAREQFGMLAPDVFRRWGIRQSTDFGLLVFKMVEAGLLSRSPDDSLEDFKQGFDFATAFRELDLRLGGGEDDGGGGGGETEAGAKEDAAEADAG